MARERTYAAIDLGNYKTRVIVGEISDDRGMEIRGLGLAPSLGLRKGAVIDVEETISSLVTAIEDAERMSGERISHAYVGINGPHIEAYDSHGVIAVATDEVTESDIERVLETAQAISIPPHKRVIKVIPRSYTIDGQEGIKSPQGMNGRKLEVHALILVGDMPSLKNIEKTVFEAGVDIDDLTPTVLAASEAVLSRRQKELGVAVVDIGSSCTTIAVWEEGILLAATTLPVGAESVTNDLAIGLRCSIDTAEKVKLEHGTLLRDGDPKAELDLGKLYKNEEGVFTLRYMQEIIEARYYEIFLMVKDVLASVGKDGMLPSGVVLTGGGSRISGSAELAKAILGLPSSIGVPLAGERVMREADDPSFASVVGLFLLATRARGGGRGFMPSLPMGQMGNWARDLFKKLIP